MDSKSALTSSREPWIWKCRHELPVFDLPEGFAMIELDGRHMINFPGLFREMSSAFKFPDYFGNNFNALLDCLTDLSWLPAVGYVVLFRESECVLRDETEDDLSALFSLMRHAAERWATPIERGEWWDRPAVPFHTVLALSDHHYERFSDMLRGLGVQVLDIEQRNRSDQGPSDYHRHR